MPTKRTPKYRFHKSSGQGFVEIDGHRTYLGKFNSPETRQKYHRLIAELLASGGHEVVAPDVLTVDELIAKFWTWAVSYYKRSDGTATSELCSHRVAFKPLQRLYGDVKVSDFGPLSLKAVRQEMVDGGWCRKTVNQQVGRVKFLFRWGVENELVEPTIAHGLACVPGLRYGRSGARESQPVKPVSAAVVDETVLHTTQMVGAMIRLQQLTGMRPGELVQLRVADLTLDGDVWEYRPRRHKTMHHGRTRVILIGPRGQDVLRPYLTTDREAYVFSPRLSEEERRAAATAARVTPTSCGNVPGSNVVRRPQKAPGDHYDTTSYGHAIRHACGAAWPVPDGLSADEAKQWRKEHRWSPNQLRHSFATECRKTHGLEASQLLLGHARADITEVYAETNLAKAISVIRRIG